MKATIFCHGDTDGICAGSIVKARYPEANVWLTNPVGLLKDLQAVDSELVVVCDIAISERDAHDLFSEFSRISAEGTLIYIDHHPLPTGIVSGDLPATRVLRDIHKSSSELAYYLFMDEVDRDMNRVALFGAISDYADETEFVERELEVYDKRTIYMEAGILSQGLGGAGRDYAFKRMVVSELASRKLPSSMDGVVSKALEATKKEWKLYEYVKENVHGKDGIAWVRVRKGYSPTKAAKFAIGFTGAMMGIGISPGNGYFDLSLRKRRDFPLNLDRALRTIAVRHGGSGGGHDGAAGARIPKEGLDKFMDALGKEVYSSI
jgi:RecJ-like exonuclease